MKRGRRPEDKPIEPTAGPDHTKDGKPPDSVRLPAEKMPGQAPEPLKSAAELLKITDEDAERDAIDATGSAVVDAEFLDDSALRFVANLVKHGQFSLEEIAALLRGADNLGRPGKRLPPIESLPDQVPEGELPTNHPRYWEKRYTILEAEMVTRIEVEQAKRSAAEGAVELLTEELAEEKASKTRALKNNAELVGDIKELNATGRKLEAELNQARISLEATIEERNAVTADEEKLQGILQAATGDDTAIDWTLARAEQWARQRAMDRKTAQAVMARSRAAAQTLIAEIGSAGGPENVEQAAIRAVNRIKTWKARAQTAEAALEQVTGDMKKAKEDAADWHKVAADRARRRDELLKDRADMLETMRSASGLAIPTTSRAVILAHVEEQLSRARAGAPAGVWVVITAHHDGPELSGIFARQTDAEEHRDNLKTAGTDAEIESWPIIGASSLARLEPEPEPEPTGTDPEPDRCSCGEPKVNDDRVADIRRQRKEITALKARIASLEDTAIKRRQEEIRRGQPVEYLVSIDGRPQTRTDAAGLAEARRLLGLGLAKKVRVDIAPPPKYDSPPHQADAVAEARKAIQGGRQLAAIGWIVDELERLGQLTTNTADQVDENHADATGRLEALEEEHPHHVGPPPQATTLEEAREIAEAFKSADGVKITEHTERITDLEAHFTALDRHTAKERLNITDRLARLEEVHPFVLAEPHTHHVDAPPTMTAAAAAVWAPKAGEQSDRWTSSSAPEATEVKRVPYEGASRADRLAPLFEAGELTFPPYPITPKHDALFDHGGALLGQAEVKPILDSRSFTPDGVLLVEDADPGPEDAPILDAAHAADVTTAEPTEPPGFISIGCPAGCSHRVEFQNPTTPQRVAEEIRKQAGIEAKVDESGAVTYTPHRVLVERLPLEIEIRKDADAFDAELAEPDVDPGVDKPEPS